MKRGVTIHVIFVMVGEVFTAANAGKSLSSILVPVDGSAKAVF
jgi:hypothetical protein